MSINSISEPILRVEITSLTSSFRNIRFQHGYLPTYPIPPISTIYGMISAIFGEIVPRSERPWLGYTFKSMSKITELNRILGRLDKEEKPIVKQEILFDNHLTLFTLNHSNPKYSNNSLLRVLKEPFFSIYLGRSEDLATIKSFKKTKMIHIQNDSEVQNNDLEVILESQWTPTQLRLSGILYNVPIYLAPNPERKHEIISIEPLTYVKHIRVPINVFRNQYFLIDEESNKGVCFYN